MDRLGVSHHFHDIFDIACADYVPKPAHETYLAFIEQTIIKAETAAMFEDLSRNLKAPHDLGMRTILVESGNHPDEGFWQEPEGDDHIHHVTDDLGGFFEWVGVGAVTLSKMSASDLKRILLLKV